MGCYYTIGMHTLDLTQIKDVEATIVAHHGPCGRARVPGAVALLGCGTRLAMTGEDARTLVEVWEQYIRAGGQRAA